MTLHELWKRCARHGWGLEPPDGKPLFIAADGPCIVPIISGDYRAALAEAVAQMRRRRAWRRSLERILH